MRVCNLSPTPFILKKEPTPYIYKDIHPPQNFIKKTVNRSILSFPARASAQHGGVTVSGESRVPSLKVQDNGALIFSTNVKLILDWRSDASSLIRYDIWTSSSHFIDFGTIFYEIILFLSKR